VEARPGKKRKKREADYRLHRWVKFGMENSSKVGSFSPNFTLMIIGAIYSPPHKQAGQKIALYSLK